jgi:hypothetical protein
MKHFLLGIFVGLVVLLTGFLVIVPQYSDYRSASETSAWFAQIEGIQDVIEQNALKNLSLSNAGRGVDKKIFQRENMDELHIFMTGEIVIRGGRDGQMLMLVPSFDGTSITWHCIGGPIWAMPPWCQAPSDRDGAHRLSRWNWSWILAAS